MAEPCPTLVISSSERIMFRPIDKEGDAEAEYDHWSLSDPIPGVQILNSWEIYYNIWIILSKTEDDHYHLFLTMDRKKFTLVHDHDCRIYNLFWIDSGHMIFCAEDGWWATINTAQDWTKFADAPTAKSVAIQDLGGEEPGWLLTAYAEDHKLYTLEYPEDSEWIEDYDTTQIWTGKWYPALASSPIGILIGAGNKLLRKDRGGSWITSLEVDGIIKSIVISNQSNLPTFFIEVEKIDGSESQFFWSYDMGDSIVPDLNRIGPTASVQSVYPTGTSKDQTMFAVLGRRMADGLKGYKIIESDR